MYLERLFCFTHQTQLTLQRGTGEYMVTIDRDISYVSAPFYTGCQNFL